MALLFLQRHSFLLHLLFLLALLPPFTHQIQQQRHHPKINTVDLNALIAIKNSLIELPTTSFFSTWDVTASDPCSSFSGVTCALDPFSVTLRVTILTLGTGLYDSSRLAGSLSNSIANLTELTQLILSPGMVTGPIPPQLGRLRNLRVLSLTNNCLTGTIPDSLSALKNLHTLDLSYNQHTGSIPPGLTKLPELKVLILASNSLSGELPTVSAQLLHLDLKSNRFTGLLPPSMPLSLRYLSLSDNIMWGPLNGLESLSELVYLDLSMNKFSGPIPTSLFFSTTLSSLFLQRNNLSGRVPQQQEGPTAIEWGGVHRRLEPQFFNWGIINGSCWCRELVLK
ncbi:Leucine-rich repeat receptor-like protein kinase [Quillaja saponaria]|uniref:Leucine-rich repeat receptor-like protein kinase n=1 Tax=Quillaja saponaria TaxID=32244 RepID=A0AAD7PQN9_QUISA|nr:Leucine-rich repeat receptor-like protein kinase [Quillaja saponaria]